LEGHLSPFFTSPPQITPMFESTSSNTKQQFVVIHTQHHTEIPTLPDSWVTNTPSAKMLCPQKKCFSSYFRENIKCLNVCVLSYSPSCSFSVSSKTVYRWGYDKSLCHERYVFSNWPTWVRQFTTCI